MRPGMYTSQELTDRLVVATEEQDCLYVLYWLEEMTQLDCRDHAINAHHSWKGCSALMTVVDAPWTTLRETILKLLLLSGATSAKSITDSASQRNNWGALQVILDWSKGGKDQEDEVTHLLSLTIEDAADWLDRNLPPPPNARNLTGWGELPPEPLKPQTVPQELSDSLSLNPVVAPAEPSKLGPLSSTSKLDVAIATPTLAPVQTPRAQTSNEPAVSSSQLSSSSRDDPLPYRLPEPLIAQSDLYQRSISGTTASASMREILPPRPADYATANSSAKLAQGCPQSLLSVGRIPLGSRWIDVAELFVAIGVDCRVLRCASSHSPTYAVVEVPADDAALCIALLDGKPGGTGMPRMWCDYCHHTAKYSKAEYVQPPTSPRAGSTARYARAPLPPSRPRSPEQQDRLRSASWRAPTTWNDDRNWTNTDPRRPRRAETVIGIKRRS